MFSSLPDSPATFALLVVNVAVSLYVLLARPDLMGALALRPYDVVHKREYGRLLTGGFVHGSLGHLLFNMVTLLSFGPVLEGVLGIGRFLVLYFGSELASAAFSIWRHRRNPDYAAVGASGAISGVVFAFCLFAPLAMLYIFFAIPMPAILFAVLYIVGSVWAMRQSGQGLTGGIAHEAHIGGAVAGVVLTLLLMPEALGIFLSQIGLG